MLTTVAASHHLLQFRVDARHAEDHGVVASYKYLYWVASTSLRKYCSLA